MVVPSWRLIDATTFEPHPSPLWQRDRSRVRALANFLNQIKQFCPTGKSLPIFGNSVKHKIDQIQKYFAFPEGQISGTSIAIPSRQEGRIMIATNVGRVAVDAGSAENERRESVRRNRVVLTPDMLASSSGEISFSGATVARELRLTGESAL